MKTIHIQASNSYDVFIDSHVLHALGSYLLTLVKSNSKVAIVSESNVWPLYGSVVETSLKKSGFEFVHYVFPAGESSKNISTYHNILCFLAENHITRTDLLIALGGGVTGDITGFTAATYLRGIKYVQIPTTLLAMVDSSVGGKTADLPSGKNLVGAFYQPSFVFCDIETLNTLPQQIFIDGCAEVIKYGVLYESDLFAHLLSHGLDFHRELVVSRCVELKRDVVAQDEFDYGMRQKLNLGHTIGHGVESASNFSISHGQAVAIGMSIVAKAAACYGQCDSALANDIINILDKFMLPTQTSFSAATLYSYALADKKRSGKTVNLIVPKAIGNCIILPIAIEELESFIKEGL